MVDPVPELDIGAPVRPTLPPTSAERWAQWRHDPRVFTAALIVVALAAGAWWLRLSSADPSGASPRTDARASAAATVAPTSSIGPTTTSAAAYVVDVVGAVRKPGVVSLPGSARVVDAVNAAGGALPTADLDRINLAAHLVDGMRIAVPRRGAPADEAGPTNDPGAAGAAGGAGAAGASGTPTPSTPIDLNTATEPQLEALPGIGPSLAQAILQEREREGGFHSVDDLRRVRGIGDVRFAQLRGLVTV
ncbi:MAG TPA: ComEA family DNA-binding protein [Acidimicrobiia bacterium]|nr:ComEA family DNA-binding protein [Acidimicrobiia bacterium]